MADTDRQFEPNGQLGLLGGDKTFDTLPSAKMSPSDKKGVHGWTNFYAAFSETFVIHALTAMGVGESDLILDPFAGSGTTLVASMNLGIPAIGIDLDPFSCLLARAKVATNADPKIVRRILRPSSRVNPLSNFSERAIDLFDTECLCYASSVFTRVQRSTGHDSTILLSRLFADRRGRYDSEVVAIAALCIGASQSANLIRGSNPTWYRKGAKGEKDNIQALLPATQEAAETMVDDLEALQNDSRARDIRIYNRDVSKGLPKLGKKPVSHIVTSPPYLTRMDYVVKHLPHLLILDGMSSVDLERLRDRMIGTPRILSKGEFDRNWGETCVSTLKRVQSHPSYASSNYYVWTYFQYFRSLYEALAHIAVRLEIGAKGLIVVQDSFYKDIHIPLSRIVVEMLEMLHLSAEIVSQDSVRPKLQRLNPAHKSAKRNVKSSEDAIFFMKE